MHVCDLLLEGELSPPSCLRYAPAQGRLTSEEDRDAIVKMTGLVLSDLPVIELGYSSEYPYQGGPVSHATSDHI